jgi:hypothetical protein
MGSEEPYVPIWATTRSSLATGGKRRQNRLLVLQRYGQSLRDKIGHPARIVELVKQRPYPRNSKFVGFGVAVEAREIFRD